MVSLQPHIAVGIVDDEAFVRSALRVYLSNTEDIEVIGEAAGGTEAISMVENSNPDVLLLDLPPGTGDIAISVAQLIPDSELVIVTTPQAVSAEVAERAGQMVEQTGQNVVGVVENMSYLAMPDGSRNEIFGRGGGQSVANVLSERLGRRIPLLGTVPIEPALRVGGDDGVPLAIQEGDSPAQTELRSIADGLAHRSRGLAGRGLGVTPI